MKIRNYLTRFIAIGVASLTIFLMLKMVTFSQEGILKYDCDDSEEITEEMAYLDQQQQHSKLISQR